MAGFETDLMAHECNLSLDSRGQIRNVLVLYLCRPLRVQTLDWVDWLTAEDVNLPGRGRVDTP